MWTSEGLQMNILQELLELPKIEQCRIDQNNILNSAEHSLQF